MARTANERTTVAPARACAYAVVRRVFEEAAFADQALHGEARGLEPRDRALAMRLAYGTVQRRATLDHVIERLASRPVGRLEPAVLAALRLGVFQLAFLDRVPAHAAVGESVELAKRHARGGAGTPYCAAPPARRPRSSSRCPRPRPPTPRSSTPTRPGSPNCGSTLSARTPPAP